MGQKFPADCRLQRVWYEATVYIKMSRLSVLIKGTCWALGFLKEILARCGFWFECRQLLMRPSARADGTVVQVCGQLRVKALAMRGLLR